MATKIKQVVQTVITHLKRTAMENHNETPKTRLGDKARDAVSGFTGICVARTEWLNGCWRITLQPQGLDKDGKPQETQTFDDFQLEIVERNRYRSGSKETGGPRDQPVRAKDPV